MKPVFFSALLVATAMCSRAYAVTDNFNRTALGPDWTVRSGIFNLNGATVGGSDEALMTFAPGTGQTNASVDVILNGSTSPQYGALVLGYADTGQCAFIKIQDNDSITGFNAVAFYYYNQNNHQANGHFLTIDGFTTVQSVRITASLTGTFAVLKIDSNFDGLPDATYSYDYATDLGTGVFFGNQVGVGLYGGARLDNFTVVPEPSCVLLTFLGAIPLLLRARYKTCQRLASC